MRDLCSSLGDKKVAHHCAAIAATITPASHPDETQEGTKPHFVGRGHHFAFMSQDQNSTLHASKPFIRFCPPLERSFLPPPSLSSSQPLFCLTVKVKATSSMSVVAYESSSHESGTVRGVRAYIFCRKLGVRTSQSARDRTSLTELVHGGLHYSYLPRISHYGLAIFMTRIIGGLGSCCSHTFTRNL